MDFERFFNTYYKSLFKIGFYLSSDKELTKDLLHSFFLELWENRFQSQNIQYLDAYLKKSFRRKVIKALQAKSSQKLYFKEADLSIPPYEQLIIDFQEKQQLRKQLAAAIQQLPQQQKEVLELRFKRGLDYQEIAEVTGKSTQTIYNQIYQAIQKLRKFWK